MAALRWVVAGVLVCSGVLTAVLTAFGWRFRDEVGADWFAAMMGTNTAWIAAALARLAARDRSTLVVLEHATIPLVTAVPVLWFCFVLAYTGRERLLDRRGLAVVWAVPALVLAAVATSPFHDLYFTDFRVVEGLLGTTLDSAPGPVAWLNLAYFFVLVTVGAWLIVRMAGDHDRLYADQATWLFVGTLAPVVVLVWKLVFPLGQTFPPLSLGFSVLGLAYARGLFSHRLLDLTPAARRIGIPEAFDDLGEGVVVVDTDRDVVAINERACRLFDCEKTAVLGAPLDRVSPALARHGARTQSVDVGVDGRILSVSASPVTDARDRPTGEALVVRDVTDDRRREQRLDVLNRVFRHNIRNSMNAVVSPTEMLAERLAGTERELAETAFEAGETVVELSETIRAVEEMMTGPVDPVTVVVGDVVDDAAATVRDDTAFALARSVPADLELVTDPSVLAVVLEHVLANAAGHADADRPRVEVTAEPRADGCLVHVDDEGPGVPASELAVLRQGTETQLDHASGIGLWAIHWGVTRLGGAVRFRVHESGTRVTLWLPSLDGERPGTGGSPGEDAPMFPSETARGSTGHSGAAATTADEEWFGNPPPEP